MTTSLSQDFFSSAKPIALVVGGTSFVGSRLCEELLSKGVKVVCYNVSDLVESERVSHLVSSDFVLVENTIAEILSSCSRVDYIFLVAEVNTLTEKKVIHLLDFSTEKDARFMICADYRHEFSQEYVDVIRSYAKKKNVDFRQVRWVDVYGPDMPFEQSLLGRILKNTIGRKVLSVPGDRESFVYPVFVKDVVEGILKAMIAPGTKGEVFTFAGDKVSLFNLSNQLSEMAGGVEVEFVSKDGGEKEISEETLNSGRRLIGWEQKKSLEEGIRQTLSWFDRHPPKVERTKTASRITETVIERKFSQKTSNPGGFWEKGLFEKKEEGKKIAKSGKKLRRWLFVPFLGLALVFWVFALPALQLGIGTAELGFAQKDLELGKTSEASVWFDRSVFWFETAAKTFPSWSSVPGFKNEALKFSTKSTYLAQLARVGKKKSGLVEQTTALRKGIFGKEVYEQEKILANIQTETNAILNDLGFLEAGVGKGGLVFTLPFVGTKTVLEPGETERMREQIVFLQQLLPVLPDLLGESAKKTYLVLLQDNLELSPSGGLIASYALVTFDKGRMVNLEVAASDLAEKQLKGQIDPPKPLGQYAQLENWNLSYSGWSADFPTSAARASWFIEKELEQKIDGVIAYDLEFVQSVLSEGHELELEGGEIVNAQNVYSGAGTAGREYYVNLNRKFLHLLANFKDFGKVDFNNISRSVKEKHLAFWTTNSRANSVLAKYSWDGGVKSVSCDSAQKFGNCSTDYLQVIDANLGKNKTSQFIEKSYALEVDIQENTLSHRMTITLENKSTEGYKSYLRLYTPGSTKLNLAALIDPEDGAQENVSPEEGSDKGKRTFGKLIEIPSRKKRQFVYLWEVPRAKSGEEGELVFLWQKQMGTRNEPLVLRINLPGAGLKVGAYPVPSLTENGTIGYNVDLSQDLVTNLVWQPK